jgi:uncharacterized membrane protein (DUF441 family)
VVHSGYVGGWAMSVLRPLAKVSVETVSLAVALVVVAILGFSPSSILGAALSYLGTRAILRSWVLDRPLPSATQVFLFVLTLFGLIGGVQFIVFAAVLIAVFLLKEVKLKAPTLDGLIESARFAFLGVVMPVIGVLLPIIPFYETAKKFRYDLAGAMALLLLVVLAVFAFYTGVGLAVSPDTANLVAVGGMFNDVFAGVLGPLSPSNPLIWTGIIAYEEFIGRVTPFANAMFVMLHFPSRLWEGFKATGGELTAVAIAFLVLLIINFGTRWLWDTYQKHGIVVSIASHAFYNAGVSAFVDLLEGNVLNFMILLFIGLVGFLYSAGRRLT